ncbi:hypothetical protein K491DRAFT_683406 [Lophiostoma macrostomum CBS 122681]|uniref:Zn(2)-C6 fungal-type domain-containing protein n=1 Tax=Lophiostoma macrostomum CBS 122681 TaxID=1314788 RepID=A0A6A6SQI6_9PLEO|nr:hypothetical protein K491DRAFT_683406 [Lophiostoma macrostomum CBS 122681]
MPRKGHRKSRDGCLGCKRRKVKCDEARPICGNCHRFGLSCQAAPVGGVDRTVVPPREQFVARRGPGRPRRDWSLLRTDASTRSLQIPARPRDPDYNSALNLAHAELLHHFTTCTGPSIASGDNDPVARFWTRNAPRLGLSSPFVLHLAFSLTGRHLMHLRSGKAEGGQAGIGASGALSSRHLALTQRCNTIGLTGLNEALPNIDDTNCGSLYVASVLLCFCTFAAGPTGPEDLLVCDAGGGPSGKWLSLASGVHLIRSLFDPDLLFSGLLKPLGPTESPPDDPRPTCVCENFLHIDWIDPLDILRTFITSQHPLEGAQLYLRSYNTIAAIYEATYGNTDGLLSVHPAHKQVLLWPYSMESSFVDCLRAKDPIALLLLAYYAPLIKTMKRSWYMSAWPDHLLATIQVILGPKYAAWLAWPHEVSTRMDQIYRETIPLDAA